MTALELDRHLMPALERVVAGARANVRVVQGDALTVDLDALLAGTPAAWKLVVEPARTTSRRRSSCACSTRHPTIASLLVMVQREVGERLAAGPGTKDYGAVSVKVAYYGRAKVVGPCPRTVFLPPPNVDSALVRARPPRGAAGRRPVAGRAVRARARRLRAAAQDAAARAAAAARATAPSRCSTRGRRSAVARRGARPRRRGPRRSRVRRRGVDRRGGTTSSPGQAHADRCACSARVPTASTSSKRSPSRSTSRTTRSTSTAVRPGHRGSTVDGRRPRGVPADDDNLVVQAAPRCRRGRRTWRIAARQADPAGLRPRRRILRRRCGAAGLRDRYGLDRGVVAERSRRPSGPTSRSACTGRPAWMRGRGEIIDPVPDRRSRSVVLIVVPPFSIVDRRRSTGRGTSSAGPGATRARRAPPAAVAGLVDELVNDLEPAAEQVEPRLAAFRDALEAAAGAPALLAGSGSACWIPFEDPDEAAGRRRPGRDAAISRPSRHDDRG